MARFRQWLSSLFQNASEYHLAARIFLKLLALIYFSAFHSLTGQITGLVGSKDTFPVDSKLTSASRQLGETARFHLPTLFRFDSGDDHCKLPPGPSAHFQSRCFSACCQDSVLIVLFSLYLSLANAGQIFLNFQRDYLLLESGFLAIFLVA